MYSTCWPETMFWRQRKINFENIFILPNVIGGRSRRRFGSIFIKIPKVTSARSSLLYTVSIPLSLVPEGPTRGHLDLGEDLQHRPQGIDVNLHLRHLLGERLDLGVDGLLKRGNQPGKQVLGRGLPNLILLNGQLFIVLNETRDYSLIRADLFLAAG